jgi:predicted  nucleic acid-binding Zn-ribbon protein
MSLTKEVRTWISRVKDHRYLDALDAELSKWEKGETDLAVLKAEITKQEQKLRDLNGSIVTYEGKLTNLQASTSAAAEKLAKQLVALEALSKVNG